MSIRYLSWSDGEFSSDGIEIRRAVNEATDLTFGECPSATLNCKIVDAHNDLLTFWTISTYQSHNTYLWGQAYIGVQLDEDPYPLANGENVKAQNPTGTIVLSGRDDGLYVNGTLTNVTSQKVYGITFEKNKLSGYTAVVYCESEVRSVAVHDDASIGLNVDASYTYPPFMRRKNQYVGCYRDRSITVTCPTLIFRNGVKETWEWCPVGLYKLYRPRNVWDVELEINDAYDKMAEFDVGLFDTIPSITFPTTVGALMTSVCSACGVEGSSLDSTPLARNPFSREISCRQVVRWTAERGVGMYYIDPIGTLAEWGPHFDDDPIEFGPTDVEDGSVALNDYLVPTPDFLEIHTTDERIYTNGTGDNRYVMSGNPFYQIGSGWWPAVSDVAYPEYDPCNFSVINADPSCGYGDIFQMQIYDRSGTLVTKNGWILKETLTFDGQTHAAYECTGSEIREDNTNYTSDGLTMVSDKSAEFYSASGWVGYRLRNYMVLTRIVDVSNVNVTYQWGGVYTGDNQNPSVPQIQYPVTFIEQPVCVAQLVSTGKDGWLSTAVDYTTQDLKSYTPAYEVNRGTAYTGMSFQVHFYVMGLIY